MLPLGLWPKELNKGHQSYFQCLINLLKKTIKYFKASCLYILTHKLPWSKVRYGRQGAISSTVYWMITLEAKVWAKHLTQLISSPSVQSRQPQCLIQGPQIGNHRRGWPRKVPSSSERPIYTEARRWQEDILILPLTAMRTHSHKTESGVDTSHPRGLSKLGRWPPTASQGTQAATTLRPDSKTCSWDCPTLSPSTKLKDKRKARPSCNHETKWPATAIWPGWGKEVGNPSSWFTAGVWASSLRVQGSCFLHKPDIQILGEKAQAIATSWGWGKHVYSLENLYIILPGPCSPLPSTSLKRTAFLNPFLPGCSHLLPGPCQPFLGSAQINRDRDGLQLSGSGGENSSQHSGRRWVLSVWVKQPSRTRRAGHT